MIHGTSFSVNTFVLHHHLYLSTSFPHHPALPPVSPRTYFLISMIRNTPSVPPLIIHHLIHHHKPSPPHYPSTNPLLHTLTQAASYTTSTAVTKTHSSLPVLVSGASTIRRLLSHPIMTISSAASLVSNSHLHRPQLTDSSAPSPNGNMATATASTLPSSKNCPFPSISIYFITASPPVLPALLSSSSTIDSFQSNLLTPTSSILLPQPHLPPRSMLSSTAPLGPAYLLSIHGSTNTTVTPIQNLCLKCSQIHPLSQKRPSKPFTMSIAGPCVAIKSNYLMVCYHSMNKSAMNQRS